MSPQNNILFKTLLNTIHCLSSNVDCFLQYTGTSERFCSGTGVVFLRVCKQSYLHPHTGGETIQNQQDLSKIYSSKNSGYLEEVPIQKSWGCSMTFYTATLNIFGFCLAPGTQHLVILENRYFLFSFPEWKTSFENNFYSRDTVQCVEMDFNLLSVVTDKSSTLH